MDRTTLHREMFNEQFHSLISSKRENNSFFIDNDKYSELIQVVLDTKKKSRGKLPHEYRRLKRFDVTDDNKLIVPVKPGDTNVVYYVTNDEMFDIIHNVHILNGHKGRDKMLKEIQRKYKNITYETVKLYLSLCDKCQSRQGTTPRKAINVEPEIIEGTQASISTSKTRPIIPEKYCINSPDSSGINNVTPTIKEEELGNTGVDESEFNVPRPDSQFIYGQCEMIENRVDFPTTKDVGKRERDDCALYTELLCKKLRRLTENVRDQAMLDIDNYLFQLKQQQSLPQSSSISLQSNRSSL